MRQRGIAEDLIADVLSALNGRHDDNEVMRARNVWRRKFAAPPESASERAKQMRFLQGRGFSIETIKQAMSLTEMDGD